MDQTLISKKFIYALLVTILGFILVALHQVKPDDWFSFVQVIGGIYVVGNIAEKVTEANAWKKQPLG